MEVWWKKMLWKDLESSSLKLETTIKKGGCFRLWNSGNSIFFDRHHDSRDDDIFDLGEPLQVVNGNQWDPLLSTELIIPWRVWLYRSTTSSTCIRSVTLSKLVGLKPLLTLRSLVNPRRFPRPSHTSNIQIISSHHKSISLQRELGHGIVKCIEGYFSDTFMSYVMDARWHCKQLLPRAPHSWIRRRRFRIKSQVDAVEFKGFLVVFGDRSWFV